MHCNLVNNNYQQASMVLFTFVPNKIFGQLINILPHSLTMLNTANTEFSCIEVWFTDQKSKLCENEGNVNITHTNNWVVVIKMRYPTERKYRKYVKSYGFLSFTRKAGDK